MSETFSHGYAVVIGVNDNMIKEFRLKEVANDVQALYNVLVDRERCAYKKENVRLLKGAESTRDNILKALLWLKQKVKADTNATAVIYYSGHGYRDKTDQYYLIPYDIQKLSRVRVDALRAEEMQMAISEVQGQRTLIMLDCCHAKGMDIKAIDPDAPQLDATAFPDLPEIGEVPVYVDTGRAKAISELADGAGRAILNSSTGAESSYVSKERGMSYFTYYLIEALTGHAPHEDDDTVVLVTEVMSWVAKKVKKNVAAEIDESQTPVMRTDGVFPIAQLIGGKGADLSKGFVPPDPMEALPEVAGVLATFNQQGQTVSGNQLNAAVVEGDVNFGNQTNIGNISGGTVAIGDNARATSTNVDGDQFIMSGDFRGAILNIKSSLNNVTQSIGAIPYANDQEKEQLADLIQQLETVLDEAAALDEVPADLPDDSEKMIRRIEEMIKEANNSKPDQEVIETWGDQVKKYAAEVGKFIPVVLPLAATIVGQVLKMLP